MTSCELIMQVLNHLTHVLLHLLDGFFSRLVMPAEVLMFRWFDDPQQVNRPLAGAASAEIKAMVGAMASFE